MSINVGADSASVVGHGDVVRKVHANPATFHGVGEIVRKDGTRVPFVLTGETSLTEAEVRKTLLSEEN